MSAPPDFLFRCRARIVNVVDGDTLDLETDLSFREMDKTIGLMVGAQDVRQMQTSNDPDSSPRKPSSPPFPMAVAVNPRPSPSPPPHWWSSVDRGGSRGAYESQAGRGGPTGRPAGTPPAPPSRP